MVVGRDDEPDAAQGDHRFATVYLRLTTTPDSSHPYVANLGRITFSHVDTPAVTDKSALRKAIDQYEGLSGDAERYNAIDFGVYLRELAAARALVDADDATQTRSTHDAQPHPCRQPADPLPRLKLEDLVATTRPSTTTATRTRPGRRSPTHSPRRGPRSRTTRPRTRPSPHGTTPFAMRSPHSPRRPKTVPATPDAVSATSSGTSVTVAWSAPKDDGGSPVTGYKVTLDDGHQVEIDDPDSRSTTFTWLRSGRSYAARVQAVNKFGASRPSAATAPVVADGGRPQTAHRDGCDHRRQAGPGDLARRRRRRIPDHRLHRGPR